MSISMVEAFLAGIYVDARAREKFLSNPRAEALRAGLSHDEIDAVAQIDQVGLELFAVSLARKRQKQPSTDRLRSHAAQALNRISGR